MEGQLLIKCLDFAEAPNARPSVSEVERPSKDRRIACLLVTGKLSSSGSVSEFRSSSDFDFASLAESCYRFTPQIAIRWGEAVFLDITGCASLYSERTLGLRLTALASRFGYKCRVEIATNASTALALARFHIVSGGNLSRLPLEALTDIASPFRFDLEIQKEILDLIKTLKSLGIRNLAGFLKLPSESLASRFGKGISVIGARARGEFDPAWPGFHPKPGILEQADINEVETQEGALSLPQILFGLKSLMDRAAARLRGRGERASAIQVGLDLHAWSTAKKRRREWRIHLPLPQGSVLSLLAIVQEHLSIALSHEPLASPVKSIDFEVLETVPGMGAQRDFFSQKEEESEAWNALVGRLAHKLGRDRVFTAAQVERHLPEESWERTVQSLEELGRRASDFEWPERPVRLLKQPEPLQLLRTDQGMGRILVHGATGRRWRIREWRGPERICGDWWKQQSRASVPEVPTYFFDRDYYRAEAESGDRLWVFVDRSAPTRLFLHGYFD